MKKMHIVLLVVVAAGIASLTLFFRDITTYATFTTAKNEYKDKFVHIVATLDTSVALDYHPEKNPDYLGFTALDSARMPVKVVYKKGKPTDFEKSTKLVLKGYMRDGFFECKDIQLKCPSKYKDEEAAKGTKANTY
jgi:cytochrome c-type biogenesis protein CcmE